MTPAVTSPTAALLTAGAVAAAGIAYWSSASNTTAFGTLVLEILRVTGTIDKKGSSGKKENIDKSRNDASMNITSATTINDNTEVDEEKRYEVELNNAFACWLGGEEKELKLSRRRKKDSARKEKFLTDPHWMSEIVRTGLLSRVVVVASEGSKSLPTSSFDESKQRQETSNPTISRPTNEEDEILCKRAFRQSFRTLQKVTNAMIQKYPTFREDFFGGVFADEENNKQIEGQTNKGTQQPSSPSSSTHSLSAMSTSSSTYEVNKNDCLVEEEEGVEMLLTYLRLVELAKEEASAPPSPSSGSPKTFLCHTTEHPRRRLVPGAEGYEYLRSKKIEIQDSADHQKAHVGYTAAVHRDRKELVIALRCDMSRLSISSDDDRDQIETILTSSQFLQQQYQSSSSTETASSTSLLLLDQAAKTLSKEILLRYIDASCEESNEESLFSLSQGHTLVLCGHSSGAALACRLGELLTHQTRTTVEAPEVRVFAFGPPPCLRKYGDGPEGDYSYITSVVNNHDCVPRWTESNLSGLRISLLWTMDRKKRHFRRYFQRYFQRYHRRHERSLSYKGLVSTAEDAVVNRPRTPPPPLRIPPFSLSSRDWKAFWWSDREPNGSLPQGHIDEKVPEYIVPGKVVSIWNHSQDPTIIGAKVHLPVTNHPNPNSSNCHQRHTEGNHDILGRLWVDDHMFSDHTIEAYRTNLELLLGQVANTI